MNKNNIFRYFILLLIILCLLLNVKGAGISNCDFEFEEPNDSLNFNPPKEWEYENYAAVVSNFIPEPERGFTYNWQIDVNNGLDPNYGEYFLVLSSGDIVPEPTYARVSQQIAVETGWKISGYYFFGTCDYTPYSDYATIELIPSNSSMEDIILANITVEQVGDYGSTAGWQYFEYTFNSTQAGTYDLVMSVNDRQDNIFKSYLAVDHLKLQCINGDMNNDCIVNMYEYSLISQKWGIDCSNPDIDCSEFDLSEDGFINLEDLGIISDLWLDSLN